MIAILGYPSLKLNVDFCCGAACTEALPNPHVANINIMAWAMLAAASYFAQMPFFLSPFLQLCEHISHRTIHRAFYGINVNFSLFKSSSYILGHQWYRLKTGSW